MKPNLLTGSCPHKNILSYSQVGSEGNFLIDRLDPQLVRQRWGQVGELLSADGNRSFVRL